MLRTLTLAGAFAGALAGSAAAHDIWLTTEASLKGARVVVNHGHPGDRIPPEADKVIELDAATAAGKTALVGMLKPGASSGFPVLTAMAPQPTAPTLYAARYDNGFWVKLPDGTYRNTNKRWASAATDSLWSMKFAKLITGAKAPWSTVVGHELELVPLTDPVATEPGESLQIRVLFRGAPLADAKVERGDGRTAMAEDAIPRFTTDKDGVATIPIEQAGPQLLVVDHRVTPPSVPELSAADLYNATLAFDLPGSPGALNRARQSRLK